MMKANDMTRLATFITSRKDLQMAAGDLPNEMSINDIETLASSSLDSVDTFALLHSLRIQERRFERVPQSAEFVERTQRLREKQKELQWKMEHPDSYPELRSGVAGTGGTDSMAFGAELRSANRHLTVILNMMLTVAASFVFGFIGLQYVYPGLPQEVRLMIGLVLATIVFFADLYFVVKSLDD